MKPWEKAQTILLVGLQDRRRKLTDDDCEDIKNRYKKGEAIHAIARAYKGICSKRLIQFVIFPERLKALQEKHAKEQHWKKYFNRKQLTDSVRKLRRYKYELYKRTIKI